MEFPFVSAPVAARLEAAQRVLDGKTKPPGSLGRLEPLAARLCAIQDCVRPDLSLIRAVIFAADHGVTACEAVSPYPREVTAQMLLNFARGGAAASVLARLNGVELRVVDVGVDADVPALMMSAASVASPHTSAMILHRKVRRGTRSFTLEAALSLCEAEQAVQIGLDIGAQCGREGIGALVLGEMGIGNSSSAAALLSLLLGESPERTTGRGTGLDDDGYRAKIAVIARALQRHEAAKTPWEMLRAVGGLEIAALAGACIGAASARVPVVVDGFIATVAALLATRLVDKTQADNLRGALIFSHQSSETGHALALHALEADATSATRPLVDFEMRLGEASGALLVVPLLRAAAALFDMASFENAGVSQKTP